MIADVEIKRINTLGVIHKRRWYEVVMLDVERNELLSWESLVKPNYHEGEKATIVYSDRFAEQDILSPTKLITDVRRYSRKNVS